MSEGVEMGKISIMNRIMDKIFKNSGLKHLILNNRKKNCPILLYHSLNPKKEGVSEDLFEKHIQYLSTNHEIITLKEALQRFNSNSLNGDELVITFDDGYEDTATKALPILKKYKATATVFITTGLINNYYMQQKMINENQIKKMSKNGIEIGSHTLTHPNLTAISKKRLKEELKQSKIELEKIIGKEVSSFSYPTGFYNQMVINLVKKTGYKNGCTIFHDFLIEKEKKYEIPRMVMYSYDSILDLQAKINGDRHWISIIQRIFMPQILKKHDINPQGVYELNDKSIFKIGS